MFYPKFSRITSAFFTVFGTQEPVTCVHCTENDLQPFHILLISKSSAFFWHAPLGEHSTIRGHQPLAAIRNKPFSSASTEDGSGPGRLLRSVWGCRLSDGTGWCSATWYQDAQFKEEKSANNALLQQSKKHKEAVIRDCTALQYFSSYEQSGLICHSTDSVVAAIWTRVLLRLSPAR